MSQGKNDKQEKLMEARGYWSVTKVADKVGYSAVAVRGWMDSDPPKVEGLRIGRRRYIKVTSLMAYLGPDTVAALGIKQDRSVKQAPRDQ